VKIGEIYFIRERDRIDGGSSGYVKIGMVNDISRDSQARLHDHQTGNPRDLELHHVTQTPGPFRVERFLHQKFGPRRVRSEWFRLSDDELVDAIQTAERLAKEAFLHVPVMLEAEKLKTIESSAEKIAPTDESTQWINALAVAKEALKLCSSMSKSYTDVATQLAPEERAEAEAEELVITEHYLDKKFDEIGFSEKYPKILKKYRSVSVDIGGRFSPTLPDVELAEVARELVDFCSDFSDACDQVRKGELAFGDLFDLRQLLEQFSGSHSWDADVADAHLRVICGSSAGIDGQVTWNRKAKEKASLDLERLESDHPEKYQEFVTVKTLTRLKTRRRARREGPQVS
jgi:hypothetical protein